MLEQVNIENFRGVRKMEVPLQRVTALLGPNSSGKTTVLHAVRMACALLERAIMSDDTAQVVQKDGVRWIEVADGTLLADGAQQLSLADWQALFVDQSVANNTTATLHLHFNAADPIQEVKVELRCASNAQIKLDIHVRAEEATALVASMPKKSPKVSQTLTPWLRARSPRAVFVPPFYGTVSSEELRSRAVIDRMLGAGDQSHVVRNLVTSLSSPQLDLLNSFLETVVGARIVDRTSGDALQTEPTLRVVFADTNGPLEISAAGAGFINLVALYAALARWGAEASRRAVLFLIDEPEAHLSPMVQAESAAQIASLVTKEFSAQLMLATHSIDILNRLHRDNAQLVRCDRRNSDRPAQVLSGDAGLFEDLAGWADLTPYTAINFLAGRRVLFVEGKTERTLLPIFAALRFRNDPNGRRAFERWAIVPLDGASKIDQPKLLRRLIQSQAIQTRVRATAFEALVVLDRDYERPPGWSAEVEEDGVTHATLVWPQHSLESLLVQPQVLKVWLRALFRDSTPADLDERVGAAIAAVDGDVELRRAAVGAIVATRVQQAYSGGQSLFADHGRVIKEVTTEAERWVETTPPAVWQRGKDRARAILGLIRAGLPSGPRDHMPTDMTLLIERADLSRIGTSQDALPAEIQALLDRMGRA